MHESLLNVTQSIDMLVRPQVALLWLVAAIAVVQATIVPVYRTDELQAAESRRAQAGWFKGIGYGSFGFRDDDASVEEQSSESGRSNQQKSRYRHQGGGQRGGSARDQEVSARPEQESNREQKRQGAAKQESQDNDEEEKEKLSLVFRDFYFGRRGQQQKPENNNEKNNEKGDEKNNDKKAYDVMESVENEEEAESEQGGEEAAEVAAGAADAEAEGEAADQEQKELQEKVHAYFSGSDDGERGDFKGFGKIAFSSVHQTSYFPSHLFKESTDSKNNDNKKQGYEFKYFSH